MLVHDTSAGRVDEQCIRFHQAQRPFIDEVSGVVGEGHVQGQHIGLAQQIVERQPARGRISPRPLSHQYVHAESLCYPTYRLPQFAVAHDTERQAGKLTDRIVQQAEGGSLSPIAARHGSTIVGKPGGQSQYQGKHMLHNRGGRVSGHIGNGDAELARGNQIDVVRSGSGHAHEFQMPGAGQQFPVEHGLVGDHDLRIGDSPSRLKR